MMTCSDTRPLLDLLVDGALAAKDCAIVLDHLKYCSPCQSEWNDMEQMRARFQGAKERPQMSQGLLEKISAKLKDEERSEQRRFFQRYVKPVPLLAIAASLALLLGFFMFWPSLHFDTTTGAASTASADALIEDLSANSPLEPVQNRSQLAERLGYELKYLPLPAWQLDKSGIYKLHAPTAMARFDFVSKDQSIHQRLSCYQAPEGAIHANLAEAQTQLVGSKRVLFGSHGKFQFALWSQNGRDYLFVSEIPRPQLEEIVRGT